MKAVSATPRPPPPAAPRRRPPVEPARERGPYRPCGSRPTAHGVAPPPTPRTPLRHTSSWVLYAARRYNRCGAAWGPVSNTNEPGSGCITIQEAFQPTEMLYDPLPIRKHTRSSTIPIRISLRSARTIVMSSACVTGTLSPAGCLGTVDTQNKANPSPSTEPFQTAVRFGSSREGIVRFVLSDRAAWGNPVQVSICHLMVHPSRCLRTSPDSINSLFPESVLVLWSRRRDDGIIRIEIRFRIAHSIGPLDLSLAGRGFPSRGAIDLLAMRRVFVRPLVRIPGSTLRSGVPRGMPMPSAFCTGHGYRASQNDPDTDQEVPGFRRRGAVDGGPKSDDRFVSTGDERPNHPNTPQ